MIKVANIQHLASPIHSLLAESRSALELAARDEADGLEDLPYPPEYPKMPGEPKRVQPSRDKDRDKSQD